MFLLLAHSIFNWGLCNWLINFWFDIQPQILGCIVPVINLRILIRCFETSQTLWKSKDTIAFVQFGHHVLTERFCQSWLESNTLLRCTSKNTEEIWEPWVTFFCICTALCLFSRLHFIELLLFVFFIVNFPAAIEIWKNVSIFILGIIKKCSFKSRISFEGDVSH